MESFYDAIGSLPFLSPITKGSTVQCIWIRNTLLFYRTGTILILFFSVIVYEDVYIKK